jgi:hypothetical protein
MLYLRSYDLCWHKKKASMMLAYQTSDTAGCAHPLIYQKPIFALCLWHRSYEAVFLKI